MNKKNHPSHLRILLLLGPVDLPHANAVRPPVDLLPGWVLPYALAGVVFQLAVPPKHLQAELAVEQLRRGRQGGT